MSNTHDDDEKALEADMRAFMREEYGDNVEVDIVNHDGVSIGRVRRRRRPPWYVRAWRWAVGLVGF